MYGPVLHTDIWHILCTSISRVLVGIHSNTHAIIAQRKMLPKHYLLQNCIIKPFYTESKSVFDIQILLLVGIDKNNIHFLLSKYGFFN